MTARLVPEPFKWLLSALATAKQKASSSSNQTSSDVSASSPVSWLVLASLQARVVRALLCTGK